MQAVTPPQVPPVLCVDLDGTLARTDTLLESIIALARRRPWLLALLPLWLLRGRPHMKARVAAYTDLDAAAIPYNAEVVEFLRRERDSGRTIVLATASHVTSARRVADHLGLFTAVHATDGDINLKGARKAEALSRIYGAGAYSYAGNSRADLAVWESARSAVLVDVPDAVRAQLDPRLPVEREFARATSPVFELWRSLRPHQWIKNALLAVPLLTAHRYLDPHAVAQTLLAIVAMCLAASAIYVVNDLLDLAADRRHPTKRGRPLAAGTLPLGWGIGVVPVLVLVAALVSLALPVAFSVGLAAYALAAIVYSLWIKQAAWLDAVWLAGLYTLRIYLGALAIGVPVSAWLLAFATFAFLSLAFLKRFTELEGLAERPGVDRARGYHLDFRKRVEVVGLACAFLAAGVLVLYFESETVAVLYRRPWFLWGVGPLLLYLLLKAWWMARRGRMHEDPVVYGFRQPDTYLVLAAVLALILAAR